MCVCVCVCVCVYSVHFALFTREGDGKGVHHSSRAEGTLTRLVRFSLFFVVQASRLLALLIPACDVLVLTDCLGLVNQLVKKFKEEVGSSLLVDALPLIVARVESFLPRATWDWTGRTSTPVSRHPDVQGAHGTTPGK